QLHRSAAPKYSRDRPPGRADRHPSPGPLRREHAVVLFLAEEGRDGTRAGCATTAFKSELREVTSTRWPRLRLDPPPGGPGQDRRDAARGHRERDCNCLATGLLSKTAVNAAPRRK